MNCADNNHVTGRWNTLLDASWYRVDSRLVTIDGLGMLLMFHQVSAFRSLVGRSRDRMTTFCVFQFVPSVVLPAVFLVISWLIHVHMDIRASQAIDRSRRHLTMQFTFMSHRS